MDGSQWRHVRPRPKAEALVVGQSKQVWSLEVTEVLNRSVLNKWVKRRVRERECVVCRVFYSEKDKGQTDRKKV